MAHKEIPQIGTEDPTRVTHQGKIFTITQTDLIDKDGIKHVIERCQRADVVTIIGLSENNEVLLINEFRPGRGERVNWLPGGKVAENEEPELTAQREFEEETGYHAEKYSLFHEKYPSDSFINSGYVYLATGIQQGTDRVPDESGEILVFFANLDEAIQMCLEGDIPNEFFGYLFLKLQSQIKNNKE